MKAYSLAIPKYTAYLAVMRYTVLIAFFALQLSVFTCGFDTHVHTTNSDLGHIAQHAHEKNTEHQQAADHACHVHTSHTFVEVLTANVTAIPLIAPAPTHALIATHLKQLPFLIEHPPKTTV
ncbi:MAG: hypothetical protein Q9M44_00320 [Ghiorsea sp.]|nr:hypothetical protein [Ghiorsea sp.]